jgi:hypothetical protein
MKQFETVVFEVKDRQAFKAIYDAHLSGEQIMGAYPRILAHGDQVTTPGEIVDGLSRLDPDGFSMQRSDSGDRTLLRELIAMAEGHINKNH